MGRKKAENLEQARNQIRSRYRRGRKAERIITSEEKLTPAEVEAKKLIACYLKVTDFSYSYIADTLHVSKNLVKTWIAEPQQQKEIERISKDFREGAIEYAKTFAIELMDIIIEIARTAEPNVALKAAIEGLGMVGIVKLNKSESLVDETKRREVDIVDRTGVLEYLKDADPTVRQAAAQKMAEIEALSTEYKP